jgi:hypothetical protein
MSAPDPAGEQLDARSLVTLILRVAGALVLVFAITAIPRLISAALMVKGDPESSAISAAVNLVLAVGLPALLGVWLIRSPGIVANRIVLTAASPQGSRNLTRNLQAATFSVVGLWFATQALIDGVYWWAKLRLYHAYVSDHGVTGHMPEILSDDFAGVVATVFEFVLGIAIFLGANGFVRLWWHLRAREQDGPDK